MGTYGAGRGANAITLQVMTIAVHGPQEEDVKLVWRVLRR